MLGNPKWDHCGVEDLFLMHFREVGALIISVTTQVVELHFCSSKG